LLKAENGLITPGRRSLTKGKNGYYDYGFCQINKGYHPKIVEDKRFFTDWKWQMNKCLELYHNNTKFYGKKNIPKVKKFFTWK